jgi:hypothetical protein
MTIKELQVGCYLYERFTDYDRSYKKLWELKELDLIIRDHTVKLIQWLRGWGCRQFKNENDELSIQNLISWYSSDSVSLPTYDSYLLNSTEKILKNSVRIFDKLSNIKISERLQNNRNIDVSVGPVGAAKILFALRPNYYSPWDKPICEKKHYQFNGNSYVKYLNDIKDTLEELEIECRLNGFEINELPQKINRPISTLPKIIDEYNWVTITRNCDPVEILKISSIKMNLK